MFTPPESKGVVQVCDGEGVPGVASQCARLESVYVMGDVGDDHFYDLVRDAAG